MNGNSNSIQEKKNKRKKKNNNKEDNWNKFFSSCGYNIITTSLLILVGCNFIFYTSFEEDKRKLLFPIDKILYGIEQDFNGNYNLELMKNSMKDSMKDQFPYNMINNKDDIPSKFTNWIGKSVAVIMIKYREVLLDIFKKFGSVTKNDGCSYLIQFLSILLISFFLLLLIFNLLPLTFMVWFFPICLLILLCSLFIIFYFYTSYLAEPPYNILFWIVSFLGPSAVLSTGLVVSLFFIFLFTFTFRPGISDKKKLTKIFTNNLDLFPYIYGFMCILSALTHLTKKYSIPVSVIYLIMLASVKCTA